MMDSFVINHDPTREGKCEHESEDHETKEAEDWTIYMNMLRVRKTPMAPVNIRQF